MTQIIVASIGASGSRLMAQLLRDATGRSHANDDFPGDWRGKILHTHLPYHVEYERKLARRKFKAVYMLGHIGDAICSFYEGRISVLTGFKLMGIDGNIINEFVRIEERDKTAAWMYMVDGDKLGWKENILSWDTAPNTLSVRYEALCLQPMAICEIISQHIGYTVTPPKIITRKSDWRRLPYPLKKMLIDEYSAYMFALKTFKTGRRAD